MLLYATTVAQTTPAVPLRAPSPLAVGGVVGLLKLLAQQAGARDYPFSPRRLHGGQASIRNTWIIGISVVGIPLPRWRRCGS